MIQSRLMARLDLSPLIDAVYGAAVGNRRLRVLAGHLADAIPLRGTVLDIGCGDGRVARALMRERADLQVDGADIDIRPDARIPVTAWDGQTLPYANSAYDYVMLVDVLCRATDPAAVLAEASRVAAKGVVLKDHLREGRWAEPTLRFLHAAAGRRGGPAPENLLAAEEWQALFYRAGLTTVSNVDRLGLYPPPLTWLFDRRLHFVALLTPRPRLRPPSFSAGFGAPFG
jgi:SAM-dependent methyltransferase